MDGNPPVTFGDSPLYTRGPQEEESAPRTHTKRGQAQSLPPFVAIWIKLLQYGLNYWTTTPLTTFLPSTVPLKLQFSLPPAT